MAKKRTENDIPIPQDLVDSSAPPEAGSSDDWDRLFNPSEGMEPMVLHDGGRDEEEEAAPVSTRFLGFRLGQEHFAVPILHLSEVVRYQEITAVPRVRSFVRGIISVRGMIVPILDLQLRLSQKEESGVQSSSADPQGGSSEGDAAAPGQSYTDRRVLITQHGGEVFGLLVDEVSDVFVADPVDIEPPPATLPRRLLEFVSGIARVQGRIHTVLEVPAVLRFTAVAPEFRTAEAVR